MEIYKDITKWESFMQMGTDYALPQNWLAGLRARHSFPQR